LRRRPVFHGLFAGETAEFHFSPLPGPQRAHGALCAGGRPKRLWRQDPEAKTRKAAARRDERGGGRATGSQPGQPQTPHHVAGAVQRRAAGLRTGRAAHQGHRFWPQHDYRSPREGGQRSPDPPVADAAPAAAGILEALPARGVSFRERAQQRPDECAHRSGCF